MMPLMSDLDWKGLDFSEQRFKELMPHVDPASWMREVESQKEYCFRNFPGVFPKNSRLFSNVCWRPSDQKILLDARARAPWGEDAFVAKSGELTRH